LCSLFLYKGPTPWYSTVDRYSYTFIFLDIAIIRPWERDRLDCRWCGEVGWDWMTDEWYYYMLCEGKGKGWDGMGWDDLGR